MENYTLEVSTQGSSSSRECVRYSDWAIQAASFRMPRTTQPAPTEFLCLCLNDTRFILNPHVKAYYEHASGTYG